VIAGTQAMTVYKPLKVIATEAAACRSTGAQ
jgi:ABC-type xylose transport system substrate-binding protein